MSGKHQDPVSGRHRAQGAPPAAPGGPPTSRSGAVPEPTERVPTGKTKLLSKRKAAPTQREFTILVEMVND